MRVIISDESLIRRFDFEDSGNVLTRVDKHYDPQDWDTFISVHVDKKTRRIYAYNDMYGDEVDLKSWYIGDLLRAQVVRK